MLCFDILKMKRFCLENFQKFHFTINIHSLVLFFFLKVA